ncbi:MAG: hypothetical protein WAW77_05855 [Caldibacillus thermoamylovorans]
MIISIYPNERQLVNAFIEYTFYNPIPLTNGETRKLFIWGNEIWLPDGKSRNRSGILDVIGTDEKGDVWLIEAKLCSNPELNENIWREQLDPYRLSLSKRSEDEIVMGARRYLIKANADSVFPPFIDDSVEGLYDGFKQWCVHWGFTEEKAKWLYDCTIQNIMKGSVIACVLADVFDEQVWEKRVSTFAYGGFGCIAFQPFGIIALLDYKKQTMEKKDIHCNRGTWAELVRKKNKVKPTPDTVELYLSKDVIDTYGKIREFLLELGWDKSYRSNQKAFIIDLPTKYGVDIRIHIGWVDADGSMDINYRTVHNFGLKFNIDFRHFKKDPTKKEICYRLAKRLAMEARYNGRGTARVLNQRDLTDDEFEKWDGEMYRMVDKYNRDYIGREEEAKDLEAVFRFLKDIVIAPVGNKDVLV